MVSSACVLVSSCPVVQFAIAFRRHHCFIFAGLVVVDLIVEVADWLEANLALDDSSLGESSCCLAMTRGF